MLDALLSAGDYSAARPYFAVGAREIKKRADGLQLRRWLERVPMAEREASEWHGPTLWVAYRSGDRALARAVTARQPGAFPAFEAFAGAWLDPWPTVLRLAEAALAHPETDEARVGARFRAVALAQLQDSGWEAAFEEALQIQQTGRDRGLLYLEWAHQLVSRGREAQARDAWAQAVAQLRADPWAVSQALSNLGITCLRLDDLPAAERAFARAVERSRGEEKREPLSVAWRGLGALYLWSGQLGRAEHAYRMAEEKADDVTLTVTARRGAARVARVHGHLDEALALLRSALLYANIRDGQRHALFADLAAVQAQMGNVDAARASLERMEQGDLTDTWRACIVRAVLARQAGESDWAAPLRELPLKHQLIREEARLFPDVLGAVGVHEAIPTWWIDVNLDGPVQVSTASGPIQLRGTEASLLALLLVHGGQVGVERAVEALALTGQDGRQRKRQLNKAVSRLREQLGWPDSVSHSSALVALNREPDWRLTLPRHESRLDLFCEGLYDPWITEYRSDMQMRMFSESLPLP